MGVNEYDYERLFSLSTHSNSKHVKLKGRNGQWFSPVTLVSSTNKTERYDTAEILLKVAFNT